MQKCKYKDSKRQQVERNYREAAKNHTKRRARSNQLGSLASVTPCSVPATGTWQRYDCGGCVWPLLHGEMSTNSFQHGILWGWNSRRGVPSWLALMSQRGTRRQPSTRVTPAQGLPSCACVPSRFSRARLFAILWAVALQASSARGSLQARILEWVAMPSSRGSSPLRDRASVPHVSWIGRQLLYH